jgi:hypothetical protein
MSAVRPAGRPHYKRNLTKILQVRRQTFETAIIEALRRLRTSVEGH